MTGTVASAAYRRATLLPNRLQAGGLACLMAGFKRPIVPAGFRY
jgi:hypothetical protein